MGRDGCFSPLSVLQSVSTATVLVLNWLLKVRPGCADASSDSHTGLEPPVSGSARDPEKMLDPE